MSVIRVCLRKTAVAALRDRTWSQNTVNDSANLPIDEVLKDAPTPYLSVFTDDDDRVGESKQFDVARTSYLIVEFGVAAPIQQTEGGSGPSVSIPADTDQDFELIVDNLERQVLFALLQDSESQWGLLFRMFYTNIDSVESKRGASAEKGGSRWAARQLIFKLKTISDPVAGQPIDAAHPIQRFLELARAAPDSFKLANDIVVIEAMITTTPLPTWRWVQSVLGLGTRTLRRMGIAPAVLEGPVEAPVLTDAKVPQSGMEELPEMEEFRARQKDEEAS